MPKSSTQIFCGIKPEKKVSNCILFASIAIQSH